MAGRLTYLVVAALFPACVMAEELPDPTRPPAAIAAAAAAGGVTESRPAGLQSIIISRTRRAAIIDGETVELGGKHGDAKLIEVNEGSVVLRGAQGRQVMTLFPDVKMNTANSGRTTGKQKAKTRLQPPTDKAQPGRAGPAVRKEEE